MTLFLGAALAVTAIPTLGRMLIEFGITDTRIGTVAVAAAAVADTLVWVLLAGINSVADADAGAGWAGSLVVLAVTLGFAGLLVLVVPRTLGVYLDRSVRANAGTLGATPLAVLLVGLLLCGVATNRIGISAVFGAFLFGATLAGRPELRQAVSGRLQDVVNALFLPVFFTSVGLRTDLTALGGLWWAAAAVLAVGVAGKLGGCAGAARWAGFGWREAGILGALLNTRGLMGLVVATIGADAGLIPPSVFTALVLMAVLTTLMAGPVVVALRRGTEIEGPLRAHGFGARV
jgi:Kef-type K+ transport system membrane component KefB